MNEQQMREAFEAHMMTERFTPPPSLYRTPKGYENVSVNRHWLTWQAAAIQEQL